MLRPLLMAGTWIAMAAMSYQRRQSRAFLSLVHGRPASTIEVWRNFYAFLAFLMARLRCSRGVHPAHRFRNPHDDAAMAFDALRHSSESALFGTFHFGYSDLLGFMLAGGGRRVAMIRRRIGNSDDVRWLASEFGATLSMVWSNEPADLPLRLKAALDAGQSLAIQCDRVEGSARTIVIPFLGRPHVFPFAIYHLALLFQRPVVFCMAIPDGHDTLEVLASPIFRIQPQLDRSANLARAEAHFREVVQALETEVRQRPQLWFNFEPLASHVR